MKRIASFLLALLMVISLCACAEIQQIIDGQFGYSDPFDLGTTSTAAPLGGSEGTQDTLPLDTTDQDIVFVGILCNLIGEYNVLLAVFPGHSPPILLLHESTELALIRCSMGALLHGQSEIYQV